MNSKQQNYKFLVRLHGEYNILYLFSFLEIPHKFIIAITNLRGVSTKLNKYNKIIIDLKFLLTPSCFNYSKPILCWVSCPDKNEITVTEFDIKQNLALVWSADCNLLKTTLIIIFSTITSFTFFSLKKQSAAPMLTQHLFSKIFIMSAVHRVYPNNGSLV